MDATEQEQAGLYCSTSGTYFTDKDSLAAHYRSDFHRYNLKRKIAGLPPVTREWFDARKEQLVSASARTAATKVWVDPLTRRRFGSENTYLAHVNSNKYKELAVAADAAAQDGEDAGGDTDESGWETASDADGDAPAAGPGGAAPAASANGAHAATGQPAPGGAPAAGAGAGATEWDVRQSLFDAHAAPSMAANLEYMWKRFGFYFPEAEHLADPEGLLKYLGAKLAVGHVPLYVRGDDANARQFGSLHAVQRHMADTGRFKMAWEDNEDEYDEFYVWPEDEEADAAGKELAMADGEDADTQLRTGGFELAVGGGGGSGRVLGSRQLARYYRQSYRPSDPRRSVAVASVLAQYRALGIATESAVPEAEKRAQRARRRMERLHLNTALRANVNRNLPRNVPY